MREVFFFTLRARRWPHLGASKLSESLHLPPISTVVPFALTGCVFLPILGCAVSAKGTLRHCLSMHPLPRFMLRSRRRAPCASLRPPRGLCAHLSWNPASVRFALTGRVFLPTCTRAVSAKGMQRDFQWIASWRQGTVHACSLPTGLWCTAGLEPHVRVLRAHRARVSPDLHSCRERESTPRHCLSRSSVLGCLCVFTGVPWSVVLARCSALHECASRSPGACFCRLALVP